MGLIKGLFKLTGFTAVVGTKLACNIASGTIKTAGTAIGLASDLAKKDYEGAQKRAEKAAQKIFFGLVGSVENTLAVTGNACKSIAQDKPFLTKENADLLSKSAIGMPAGGVALSAAIPDFATDGNSGYLPDHLDSNAVHNGMFTGDDADLRALAAEGEIEGTEHIASEDIDRSLAARNEFLHENGYNSCPEGYEVHHVIPLSEGGADAPDNMILLSEDDHDKVTAEHARFYGWRS